MNYFFLVAHNLKQRLIISKKKNFILFFFFVFLTNYNQNILLGRYLTTRKYDHLHQQSLLLFYWNLNQQWKDCPPSDWVHFLHHWNALVLIAPVFINLLLIMQKSISQKYSIFLLISTKTFHLVVIQQNASMKTSCHNFFRCSIRT